MPGLEDLYREIILDHYRSPRNRGDLPVPPAHKVEGFNPLCGDEVVLSPRGVRPVDADDDLTPTKSACAHGPNDLFTGGDFLVESDRILKVKDQCIGRKRRGFGQGFGVGAGHVEDASTRAGKHEHLPRLAPRI